MTISTLPIPKSMTVPIPNPIRLRPINQPSAVTKHMLLNQTRNMLVEEHRLLLPLGEPQLAVAAAARDRVQRQSLGAGDAAEAGGCAAVAVEGLGHGPFGRWVEEGEFLAGEEAARAGDDGVAGCVEDLVMW